MDNEGKADVDERSFLVIQTSVVCALNAIAYLHLLTRWLPDLANGLASVSVKPTPNPQAQGECLPASSRCCVALALLASFLRVFWWR